MKSWILPVFFLVSYLTYGQTKVVFHSITELDKDLSAYKVVLISAPWCGICRENCKMIENSEPILSAMPPSFTFFKIENDYTGSVEFNNKTYHFVQRGPSVGDHQFLEYLIEGKKIIYPTFVIFDSENEKIGTYQGFVNESDWLEIFGTILNHFASPDSETSN